ncbi:RNase A-like domain-containing protein [Scopulibacillus cellulosilyticus]|uniref:RNase A-like domain-containing protein n=1 Tax=Scopulibacillus cellulosilyticus TaxID=2665665 RepID=A0ABW2PV32_9BACL
MSHIKVDPDKLESLASELGQLKDECDHVLRTLKWNYSAVEMTHPGINSTYSGSLYHSLVQKIEHFQSQMDDAQGIVKRTEAKFRNADEGSLGKFGGFLKEVVGVNDLVRTYSEYDPVTGEKLSAWDHMKALGWTALNFTPAKVVGVGAKVVIKGSKALKVSDQTIKGFKGMVNAAHPRVVGNMFKSSYNVVKNAPLALTNRFKDAAESIKNMPLFPKGLVITSTEHKFIEFGTAKDLKQLFSLRNKENNMGNILSNKRTSQENHWIGNKSIGEKKKCEVGESSPLSPGGGLAAHESKGGHLLERHVGKTDKELLNRLKNNPRIKGSSSFTNRSIAEKVVSETLNNEKNKKLIENWINYSKTPKLILKYYGKSVIGRTVKRDGKILEDATNAIIVLKKLDNDKFVLTGYPIK